MPDAGIRQAVGNPHPPPLGDHNPLAPEETEMLGDIGLLALDRREDVAHTPLPLGQQFDDPQSGRLSKCLEEVGFQVERLVMWHIDSPYERLTI